MLRFLAPIARVGPLDDPCLDAHALLGQALLSDFSKQGGPHGVPTCRRDHAQREQTLIKDADGPGQAQSRRSHTLLGGSLQHQGAQQGMCQQQGIEFLEDALWGQRAQGARLQAQHGPGLSDHQFGMPAFMKEHRYLQGWVQERIRIRLFSSLRSNQAVQEKIRLPI